MFTPFVYVKGIFRQNNTKCPKDYFKFNVTNQKEESIRLQRISIETNSVDMDHTHYYNSNLIWLTLSTRVDEVIPSDHPVRLVLKDSDMDSGNLSSLIPLSVSDGQKTDSSKVVSFIGI